MVVNIIDFILHADKYLQIIIENYGIVTYAILFLIIFCETAFVFTPFLPGDSLIFVAGAFASRGSLNVLLLFLLLCIAAVLGDTINYWIGYHFGLRILRNNRFVNPEYLMKTEEFYHNHGGKTIIYARFIPIIRTFAPFVAGIGRMPYSRFLSFNVIGGIAWVALALFGGYFFGQIPWVEENMTYVIFAIILVSLIPAVWEYFKNRKRR